MKIKTHLVGLLQALGVTIYCILVANFFRLMEKLSIEPPGSWGIALMLFMLVFSAAVSGLLVFGYPVYLTIHKETKKALSILTYTFLYSLLIMIIIFFIIFMQNKLNI